MVTSATPAKIPTGVPGLDTVLEGGIQAGRVYLVEGTPGTGKTTLALQFLLAGRAQGERGLYITLSEIGAELQRRGANPWLVAGRARPVRARQRRGARRRTRNRRVLHPVRTGAGRDHPRRHGARRSAPRPRVVLDSLSEMRLLAQNPLRYRRQILALKHFFTSSDCTVLLLDDRTSEPGDLQLHSIAHGVILLEQIALGFRRGTPPAAGGEAARHRLPRRLARLRDRSAAGSRSSSRAWSPPSIHVAVHRRHRQQRRRPGSMRCWAAASCAAPTRC